MKIRILKTMAGPRGCFHAGNSFECSVDEARELIQAGAAEYIGPPPQETAEVKPQENASRPLPENAGNKNKGRERR